MERLLTLCLSPSFYVAVRDRVAGQHHDPEWRSSRSYQREIPLRCLHRARDAAALPHHPRRDLALAHRLHDHILAAPERGDRLWMDQEDPRGTAASGDPSHHRAERWEPRWDAHCSRRVPLASRSGTHAVRSTAGTARWCHAATKVSTEEAAIDTHRIRVAAAAACCSAYASRPTQAVLQRLLNGTTTSSTIVRATKLFPICKHKCPILQFALLMYDVDIGLLVTI